MTAYAVFIGLVRGLWSIVSIMEYPPKTINIREGMGTRNVKHTKGWHFVIFEAWLNVGTRTAMWQAARLSVFAIFEVAHVGVLAIFDCLDNFNILFYLSCQFELVSSSRHVKNWPKRSSI